ncbi:MAG: hypothetical protein AVDCRST_MAG38-2534 [uncultured Solirubrobacteraceae bacterium]|uniref:Cyclodeaminase/cyclohydrolase domain-containing protein n=1 Tax=uncultured Solirubrobacteraceae bacterium TaxID=1162706 RepID=A0A6J4S4I9_9ACTN|nr:MAG: hypothetical protein AVDCRST_MAG38-2534 [uncultured Solirubrobacteraceae bacterium]
MAAALVEMAARFAPAAGEPGAGEATPLAIEARRARAAALELAERELESYGPVLEALRSDAGPRRDERLRAALSQAADAPLEIAACSARVAELGVAALAAGGEHLRGDALTGVLLAEAARAAAVELVEIDLAGFDRDPRRREALRHGDNAAAARRRALG